MNVLMMLTPKSEVKYILDTATIRSALEKIRIHGYSAIPVITKDGTYAGSVSEGDFLWYMVKHQGEGLRDYGTAKVREIIRPDFIPAVTADVGTEELILRAEEQNFIPVTDDRGTFIGIVTRRTVIDKLLKAGNTVKTRPDPPLLSKRERA